MIFVICVNLEIFLLQILCFLIFDLTFKNILYPFFERMHFIYYNLINLRTFDNYCQYLKTFKIIFLNLSAFLTIHVIHFSNSVARVSNSQFHEKKKLYSAFYKTT